LLDILVKVKSRCAVEVEVVCLLTIQSGAPFVSLFPMRDIFKYNRFSFNAFFILMAANCNGLQAPLSFVWVAYILMSFLCL